MVSLGLVSSVVLLVPSTLLVFTVGHRARRVSGPTFGRAVLGAVLTAMSGVLVGALTGASPTEATVVGALLGGSVLAWYPVGRPWAVRGLVAWALTLDAGALYLSYVLAWTLGAGLPAVSLIASLALWSLEFFVFLIGVGYMWEFVDVVTRREWPRYVDPRDLDEEHRRTRPFVSLHVPTHNEPPDMVIATLTRLLELDYDDYEVLLVDNNTTDPELWRPVEAFCARDPRLKFIHLEDWPGFKSGALNYALTQTDPRAELIGIVDADYLVNSDFLSDCAPLFDDGDVSFVQTPQDYRDWEQAPYFRRLYYSYGYFFDVSQRSRNERNAAIFGGTMGLIRRSTLVAAGGWDEWCITEDAELSLRLLKTGGRGLHVDRSYGHGVMPLTFEALKRQRFRWCFGGIQILRLQWRALLPGRRRPDNHLTLAQRWGYLVGGLQWFGDLAGLLFTCFLLVGAADLVLGTGIVARRLSGFLLLAVASLLVLGMLRALALVRRTSGATWREALGAFGLWLALGFTVARASARGLVARQGIFLRTPKIRGQLQARHALLGNLGESALAVVCVIAAVIAGLQATVAAVAVATLLMAQSVGYAAAPLNSLAAIRSDLPAQLERRRRLALASWGRPARRGGLVLGFGAVAAVAVVVAASPVGMPPITPGTELFSDPEENKDPPATETSTEAPNGDPSVIDPSAIAVLDPATTATGIPTTQAPAEAPASGDVPANTPAPAATTPTPAPTPAPTGAAATPPAATAAPSEPADPPTASIKPSQTPSTTAPTAGAQPTSTPSRRP